MNFAKPGTTSSDFKIDLDFPSKKSSHLFLSLDNKRRCDRSNSHDKSMRLEIMLDNYANQTKSKQDFYNKIPKYSHNINQTVRPTHDKKILRDKLNSSKGKYFFGKF